MYRKTTQVLLLWADPKISSRLALFHSDFSWFIRDLSVYPVEFFHIHNFKGRPNLFASETRPLAEESWRLFTLFTLRHCQGIPWLAAPPDSKVGSLPLISSAMVEKCRQQVKHGQTPFRTQLGFSGIWTPHNIHNYWMGVPELFTFSGPCNGTKLVTSQDLV